MINLRANATIIGLRDLQEFAVRHLNQRTWRGDLGGNAIRVRQLDRHADNGVRPSISFPHSVAFGKLTFQGEGGHVTLSTFLLHVTALKECHASLIFRAKVRPVTPAP
jgi:hypothetical protein